MYHYSSGKKLFILQSDANVSLKHLLARTDGVRGSSQRYARDMRGDRKRKKMIILLVCLSFCLLFSFHCAANSNQRPQQRLLWMLWLECIRSVLELIGGTAQKNCIFRHIRFNRLRFEVCTSGNQ